MLTPDSPAAGKTEFSIDLPEGRIAARRIDPPGAIKWVTISDA